MGNSVCIVHGNDLSEPNAGSNRVIALARALYESGYKVQLVIPRPNRELPSSLSDLDITVVPIGVGGTLNKPLRAFCLIRTALHVAKDNNSMIQIYLSTLGGYASLMGLSGYILEMNDLAFESPVYTEIPFGKIVQKLIYWIEGRSVKSARKIIVVSNYLKEFVANEWHVPDSKIVVIPNGFFQSVTDAIEYNHTTDREKYIVRTGTLFKHINVENLINLAKSLEDIGYMIYLVGDGPVRSIIEERSRCEGLNNIRILGWLPYEEAMRVTKGAEVAILTGKSSLTTKMACPVKILDYAALGKAMVISDTSELAVTFGQENAALVSSPDEPEKFIHNVHTVLKNKDLRSQLEENALRLSKDFTWNKMGEKLVDMYRSLD